MWQEMPRLRIWAGSTGGFGTSTLQTPGVAQPSLFSQTAGGAASGAALGGSLGFLGGPFSAGLGAAVGGGLGGTFGLLGGLL